MKKLGKYVFGTLSVAALAAGAYYVYKKVIKNDTSDDFDEFEDDLDDLDNLDSEEESEKNSREYVPIQMDQESTNGKNENTETADSEDKPK